jgi:hypothetical protein
MATFVNFLDVRCLRVGPMEGKLVDLDACLSSFTTSAQCLCLSLEDQLYLFVASPHSVIQLFYTPQLLQVINHVHAHVFILFEDQY